MRRVLETATLVAGIILIPCVWFTLKVAHLVPDRLLPSPSAVLLAFRDIEPNIFIHCASTMLRLVTGFFAGTVLGIAIGMVAGWGRISSRLILPSLQAVRAVPAAAAVLFFLLWFGFSEIGRLLLVALTVAANVAIASHQILMEVPEKYAVFFYSFELDGRRFIWDYSLPMVASHLLPTLRFSLALVIGAQTVSELLGAQVGLGYVIQSARATFSLPALFLAIILLGAMTAILDSVLCCLWQKLVYWRKDVIHGNTKE